MDDLNFPDDGVVERRHLIRWYPIFEVRSAPRFLDIVSREVVFQHLETGDETGSAGWHVPITCDPYRVLFGQHRIEDRLVR